MKKRKLFSSFLTLIIILSNIRAFSVLAAPGNIRAVNTFEEFQTALMDSAVTEISVNKSLTFSKSIGSAAKGIPNRDVYINGNADKGVKIDSAYWTIYGNQNKNGKNTFSIVNANIVGRGTPGKDSYTDGRFFTGGGENGPNAYGWDVYAKDVKYVGARFVHLSNGTLTFDGNNEIYTNCENAWVNHVVFKSGSTYKSSNSGTGDYGAFYFNKGKGIADGTAVLENGAAAYFNIGTGVQPVFTGDVYKTTIGENAIFDVNTIGHAVWYVAGNKSYYQIGNPEFNVKEGAIVNIKQVSASQVLNAKSSKCNPNPDLYVPVYFARSGNPEVPGTINVAPGATFKVSGATCKNSCYPRGVIRMGDGSVINLNAPKSFDIQNTGINAPAISSNGDTLCSTHIVTLNLINVDKISTWNKLTSSGSYNDNTPNATYKNVVGFTIIKGMTTSSTATNNSDFNTKFKNEKTGRIAVAGSIVPQHTVAYHANGGTGSYVDSNMKSDVPYLVKTASATGILRNNYTLTNWNTEPDGSGTAYAFGSSILLTGDMTLYAQWKYTGVKYSVFYNANGGTPDYTEAGIQPDILYAVKDITATGISRTGYQFVSWNTKADGSGTAYKPGDTLFITNDTTLYAQWKYVGALYKVSYHANGGVGAFEDTNIMPMTAYIVKSLAETGISRLNYSFVSWNTKADGTGNTYAPGSALAITGDVDLYAQWKYTGPQYMVVYQANGGTGFFVEDGIQPDLPYLVKNGSQTSISRLNYQLKSWNTKPDGTGVSYLLGDNVFITGSIVLYAQWEYEGEKYAIAYDANGGAGSYTDNGILEGTVYSVKSAAAVGISRNNYAFTSWNTKADGSGLSYVPNSSITVTANVTLYAQWVYAGPKYTVSYNANNGSGSYTDSDWQGDKAYVVKSEAEAGISFTDYTLMSWNTKSDGTGTSYTAGTSIMLTENMTLYAQWTYTGSLRHKVTYQPGIGTGFYEDLAIVPGTSYTLKNPSDIGISCPGFIFKGWNTDINGGGTEYPAGHTFSAMNQDMVLYAQWQVDLSVRLTVTYDPGIGSGGYTESSIISGSSYTIKNAAAANVHMDYFKLASWNTEPDGSGTSYTPDQVVTLTENLVLYAQWVFEP